jgi:hypothetical protein
MIEELPYFSVNRGTDTMCQFKNSHAACSRKYFQLHTRTYKCAKNSMHLCKSICIHSLFLARPIPKVILQYNVSALQFLMCEEMVYYLSKTFMVTEFIKTST